LGGSATALNSWLIERTGDELMPAYYMMAACLIGMVAVRFMVETAGASLRGTQVPGLVPRAAVAAQSSPV
jgi:MHS family proline/betaine transporter-like MFS transporter